MWQEEKKDKACTKSKQNKFRNVNSTKKDITRQ